MLRTFVYAPSATYARVRAVLRRIVHEFMHKPLTETLHLSFSRVAARHKREVRIHTRIPAAETYYILVRLEIANVETLAGRAYERAGSATQTRLGEFVPFVGFEQFVKVFGFERA